MKDKKVWAQPGKPKKSTEPSNQHCTVESLDGEQGSGGWNLCTRHKTYKVCSSRRLGQDSVSPKTRKTKIFFVYLFIYSYVHTLVGPSLPPCPIPSLSSPSPSLPGRTYFALFSNFVEEKT
jgi:hypothetical protein